MHEAADALYERAQKLAGTYREQNVLRILALLEEAADYEHPASLFGLGNWHHHGIGVVRDPGRAFRYWERAAARGHTEARFALAVSCERGAGTARDERRAFYAYEACAREGLLSARYETGRCRFYGIGTPVDRAAAERDFSLARRLGHTEAMADAAEADGPRRMPPRRPW